MAFVIADRVKETTTTAGNGTVTLLGASAGYQSFAAVGNGNTTYYCIAGQTTSEWEVGIGTYTSSGTTLSRDTVLSSSNSGNKVVFSAGTKDVFVTYPSERAVTTDTTQTLTNKTLGSGSDWNGNAVPVSYGGTGASFFTTDIVPYYNGSTYSSTNIYYSSGNVGIVESAPTTLLDVGAYFGDPFRVSTSYSDVSIIWAYRQSGVRTNKFRISYDYTNTGFYIYDITNSATRLYINNSGDIGIGTSTPSTKFDVVGSVKAQAAATQDAVLLAGRAGGTSSYGVTVTPTTLTASRTFTLPDADGTALYSGGPLGTPSSGTVTNLTGTASININGTVGATTPTTGAFTTLSASGVATFSAGTAAAPAITTSGDTNNGIFFPAADVTAITTAGSERMRVNASGNVGIGGTPSTGNTPRLLVQGTFASPTGLSPYNGLYVASTDAVAADKGGVISLGGLYQTGQEDTRWAAIAGLKENATDGQYGGYLSLYSRAHGSLGPSERVRIDPAGNVGIGTSSPTGSGSGYTTLHVNNATNGGQLHLTGGGSGAASTDGSLFTQANTELFINNQEAGPVNFYVNGSERMRITSAGNVGIGVVPSAWGGNTSKVLEFSNGVSLLGNNTVPAAYLATNLYSGNGGTTWTYKTSTYGELYLQYDGYHAFFTAASGAAGNAATLNERMRISAAGGLSVGTTADPGAGAIYATGNITAYYSDDRLKTRLGKIENALDKVDQLNGFYYEANETAQELGYTVKREVGVSAQDVQAVLPEIVVPAPIDDKYLTIHYERLVPLLIEAIKELRAEVKALKEK